MGSETELLWIHLKGMQRPHPFCICFCPNGDFCQSGQSVKPHIYLLSAPNWLLNCRIMLVSMVTRRWELLILLSWRQGYTVCDLTCAPFTAMHFVFSKAETVDLFSLERCFLQRVTRWSWLPYFPSHRIDILLCLGNCNNTRLMLIGGGSACACTRVESFATVCTMSIEQHAWACRRINIIFL